MPPRKSFENKNPVPLVATGLVLVIAVSLVVGFQQAFSNFVQHIIKDFTVELVEHVYIAGVILVMAGIYLWLRRNSQAR